MGRGCCSVVGFGCAVAFVAMHTCMLYVVYILCLRCWFYVCKMSLMVGAHVEVAMLLLFTTVTIGIFQEVSNTSQRTRPLGARLSLTIAVYSYACELPIK